VTLNHPVVMQVLDVGPVLEQMATWINKTHAPPSDQVCSTNNLYDRDQS